MVNGEEAKQAQSLKQPRLSGYIIAVLQLGPAGLTALRVQVRISVAENAPLPMKNHEKWDNLGLSQEGLNLGHEDGLRRGGSLAKAEGIKASLGAILVAGLCSLSPVRGQTSGICSRTQAVRDAIVDLVAGVTTCSDITSSHLNSIRGMLNLSNESLTSLQAGDFAGISSLQSLDLSNNDLSSLPEDVFDNLNSLESLSLSNNDLSSLPEGIFDGLSSLQRLDLQNNSVSNLTEDVFDDLSSLRKLYLYNNDLSNLPEDIFDNLNSLQRLFLGSNLLRSLPENIFDNLNSLQLLNLDGNDLSSLSEEVFNGLSSLEKLYLYNNNLSNLPEDVFNSLSSLQRLDLNINSLSSLPEDVFDGLSSLKRLSLQGNDLSSLSENVFDDLSSLQYLDLRGNPLSCLPALPVQDIWIGPDNLSRCSDTTAPRVISIVRQAPSTSPTSADSLVWRVTFSEAVSQVDRGDFTVSGSTATVQGVTAVTGATGAYDVQVSGGDLANLNGRVTLGLASSQDIVDNSGNRLSTGTPTGTNSNSFTVDNTAPTVSSAIGNGTAVAILFTEALAAAPNLSSSAFTVKRSHDGIESRVGLSGSPRINGNAVTLTLATELLSSDTAIKVSYSRAGNGNGNRLEDRAGNQVATFADQAVTKNCSRTEAVREEIVARVAGVSRCENITADHLSGITVLDLSGEGITSLVAGDFAGLISLQTLNLSNNSLSSLPENVFNSLTSLQTLNLSNNSLSGLQSATFSSLTSLQTLNLSNNSLSGLQSATFSSLTSLQTLNLSNNSLSGLQSATFSSLTSLQTLNLSNNSLSSLPEEAFHGLTSLTTLNLSSNSLSSVPLTVFNALTSLQTLNLSNNPLPSTNAPIVTTLHLFRVPALLTADTSGLSDADGLSTVRYSYQWLRVDGDGRSNETTISGATSRTYKLTAADVGKKIKVKVTFQDDGGNHETATSGAYPTSGTVTAAASCPAPTYGGGATEIWKGTLAVGEGLGLRYRFYGYSANSSILLGQPFGGLDDATFSVGSNDYVIQMLVSRRGPRTAMQLDNPLSTTDRQQIALYICDKEVLLGERFSSGEGHGNVYELMGNADSNPDLDWFNDAQRTLSISRDNVAPSLESATVNGNQLVMTFTEELETTATAPSSAFTVAVDHDTANLATNNPVSVHGRTVTLTMAEAVSPGRTVTVSYATPNSGGRLQDRKGNHVASFADQSAANAVPGPVTVSVGDAEVEEAAGATLDFLVTLSRSRDTPTTVGYATSDGTATSGGDYTAASGTVTFAAGETEQTVSVTVLDDAHDEGRETLTLTLSNPNPSEVELGDRTGTGTITNNDPMPRAWLSRFGRTVAEQVVDAVADRFGKALPPGLQVRVAGEDLGQGPVENNHSLLAKVVGFERVGEEQLWEGTAFALSPQEEGGLAFWGSGALSSFRGKEEELSLAGEVSTALLGADWRQGRWLAGAALAYASATGSYHQGNDAGEGEVGSSITGLFPYGRYALNPRLSFWALLGYGAGDLALSPSRQEQVSTTINLSLAAVGLEGVLLDGGAAGLTISSSADGLFLQTGSQKADGLAASKGDVSRLRLALEASRPFPLANHSSWLTPALELGLRQDSGDAETGFGLDLASSLRWLAPERGMAVAVKGRSLLSHGAEGEWRDQGLSASLSWDPTPSSRLGHSLSVSRTWGGSAAARLDALLSPEAFPSLGGVLHQCGRRPSGVGGGFFLRLPR